MEKSLVKIINYTLFILMCFLIIYTCIMVYLDLENLKTSNKY
jgi:hypothetical protein